MPNNGLKETTRQFGRKKIITCPSANKIEAVDDDDDDGDDDENRRVVAWKKRMWGKRSSFEFEKRSGWLSNLEIA